MNNSASEILEQLQSAKNVLINMDTRTDFDALGCSVVFSKFLDTRGIQNKVIHANKIKPTFEGIFSYSNIKQETDISTEDLTKYDYVIFLDSGSKSHISVKEGYELPINVKTINFDHHSTNESFGTYNYVFKLGSCSSVLYKFFNEIKFETPNEYFEILSMGLLTDTGFFKYDSCTSFEFRFAADMIDRGVSIAERISKLSSYEHIDQIKYKELVYRNLSVNKEKKYAYSLVTLSEIKSAGIDMDKVFVRHSDLIKYIIETDFSFVISETDSNPKYFEVSFRSKTPDIDVKKYAQALGGGGHITGAGAKLYDATSINDALLKVLSIIESN